MTDNVSYTSEAEFEEAIIEALTGRHGWSNKVLMYPTVDKLVDNWAEIVFKNNNTPHRLNGVPLSEGEKQQLVEQISGLASPADAQRFLQGKETTILRDHPNDPDHRGKRVSLTIFDPKEVAGGDSTYQIARQPVLPRSHPRDKDRRGDFTLLIWGIPVIHVELKNNGHDVSEATGQIHKYLQSNIFSGFFNALQVFIGMTPTDMRYFARPRNTEHLTDMFHFKFADRNNEPYRSWQDIARHFISIPAAHTLVGDYMIADGLDEELKVLRPYQIHAVAAIEAQMSKINRIPLADRGIHDHKGGYIWHTTGSGKTMTSFKTAMLLARDKIADKVVFVLDRIELGDQSEKEFRNFAGDATDIARPASTRLLARELLNGTERLIITSLHKLGLLTDPEGEYYGHTDFDKIQSQRVVFILDEAHRSTFGQMYANIRRCFPRAVFFGFTGTPIQEVNAKKDTQTSDLFGSELHRYSIYHGLRDGAVLQLDYQQIDIYPYHEMREKVAQIKVEEAEARGKITDSQKVAILNKYRDPKQVPWVTSVNESGHTIVGIDDLVGPATWERPEFQEAVVNEILKNWGRRSQNGKLHAMFATSRIEDAIHYYRLFQAHNTAVRKAASDPTAATPVLNQELKVTAVFSDADVYVNNQQLRTDGIFQILDDYEAMFGVSFDRAELADFKADVSDRLAHKEGHKYIKHEDMLDLVIVVDQLITGYDSKYIGTLYMDKVLEYADLVQAASRTNRIYDKLIKPQGTIVYYRKPKTMTRNFEEAFDLYAGGNARGVFVDPLPANLEVLNAQSAVIKAVFVRAGIPDYSRLPAQTADRKKFAVEFSLLAKIVETVKIQGFTWEQDTYPRTDSSGPEIRVWLTCEVYDTWLARYSELGNGGDSNGGEEPVPLDLTCLTYAHDAQRIDMEALDAKFNKWRAAVESKQATQAQLNDLLVEVQQYYVALNQDEQRAARRVIAMIQSASLDPDPSKSFRDYINEELAGTLSSQITKLAVATGVDTTMVEHLLKTYGGQELSDADLNSFGHFDQVLATVDHGVFDHWLKTEKNKDLSHIDRNWAAHQLLKEFLKRGGMDVNDWDASEFE